MKHTQGKWEFVQTPNKEFKIKSEHGTICEFEAYGDSESQANARLIAEAPTMLAMLKQVKADIYEVINGRQDASYIWHELTQLINQIEGK